MSSLVHALIATGCIALAFYLGLFMAQASIIERLFDIMTDDLLKKLHKDGFLKIVEDKDGEAELVTIAEVENLVRRKLVKDGKKLEEVEENG